MSAASAAGTHSQPRRADPAVTDKSAPSSELWGAGGGGGGGGRRGGGWGGRCAKTVCCRRRTALGPEDQPRVPQLPTAAPMLDPLLLRRSVVWLRVAMLTTQPASSARRPRHGIRRSPSRRCRDRSSGKIAVSLFKSQRTSMARPRRGFVRPHAPRAPPAPHGWPRRDTTPCTHRTRIPAGVMCRRNTSVVRRPR